MKYLVTRKYQYTVWVEIEADSERGAIDCSEGEEFESGDHECIHIKAELLK